MSSFNVENTPEWFREPFFSTWFVPVAEFLNKNEIVSFRCLNKYMRAVFDANELIMFMLKKAIFVEKKAKAQACFHNQYESITRFTLDTANFFGREYAITELQDVLRTIQAVYKSKNMGADTYHKIASCVAQRLATFNRDQQALDIVTQAKPRLSCVASNDMFCEMLISILDTELKAHSEQLEETFGIMRQELKQRNNILLNVELMTKVIPLLIEEEQIEKATQFLKEAKHWFSLLSTSFRGEYAAKIEAIQQKIGPL